MNITKSYNLRFNRELIDNRTIDAVIGVIFFIIATALGAYVRIPISGSPVPITLQTFFVMLSGAFMGRRLGLYSQLGYLLLGAIGLPIFQGLSCGMAVLLGPTGGYIVGFVFAAYLIGRILERRSSGIIPIILSFILGSLIIYAFGTAWLILLYRVSVSNAIVIGALPFVPGDIVKILVAAMIYSRVAKRARDIFPA